MITVHDRCVGESRSPVSTLEKLKRLELRMEMLTKELDLLPPDKVKVAQRVREGKKRIFTNQTSLTNLVSNQDLRARAPTARG